MHYFVACLPNGIATLLYIVSMTECTNYRPWDTETPSHKIPHDIMRSGARPIKQSISRVCCNHAFGIHESRQSLNKKKVITSNRSLINAVISKKKNVNTWNRSLVMHFFVLEMQ